MKTLEKIKTLEEIKETYPTTNFITLVEFDDAVIGVDKEEKILVYSINKIIEILEKEHAMSYDEALEWFSFNIEHNSISKSNAIFIYDEFY